VQNHAIDVLNHSLCTCLANNICGNVSNVVTSEITRKSLHNVFFVLHITKILLSNDG